MEEKLANAEKILRVKETDPGGKRDIIAHASNLERERENTWRSSVDFQLAAFPHSF